MKLVNKAYAGTRLAVKGGEALVDANGEVEIDDDATAKVLQEAGFRPVFQRKEPKAAEAPAPAPVAEVKSEESAPKHGGGKKKG